MSKIKPAVHKYWLILLAGVMWSAVGAMLIWRAEGWLSNMEQRLALTLGILGAIAGIVAYRFGMIRTAHKNLNRLCSLPERSCLFAFNSPKGYVLIIGMIALGITLRRSSIPRQYLAPIYTTMGGALLLSSLHFYERLWKIVFLKQPCEPIAKDG